MTFYRQCTLRRGSTTQVSWIPEEFATVGKYVMVNEENGWRVMEVGDHRQSGDYILDHERDYAGHRKRTDV